MLGDSSLEPVEERHHRVDGEGRSVEDADGRQDGDGHRVLVVVARDQLLPLVDVHTLTETGRFLVRIVHHRLRKKHYIFGKIRVIEYSQFLNKGYIVTYIREVYC